MAESSVLLAALSIVATVSAALIWLLKKLFTQNESTIRQNTTSTLALSQAIDKLALVSERQTVAIDKQETASKEWQAYVTKRFDELKKITSK